MAVHHSDCLVAVARASTDRVTGRVDAFSPNAEIIHIDIVPVVDLQEHQGGTSRSLGDCKRVLRPADRGGAGGAQGRGARRGDEGRRQWAAQLADWKRDFPLRYDWDDEVINRPST